MLRGLGLKGNSVVLMVLTESFIFSVPAILLSFVVAYLINIVTSIIVFHKISMASSYFLSTSSIIYVSYAHTHDGNRDSRSESSCP